MAENLTALLLQTEKPLTKQTLLPSVKDRRPKMVFLDRMRPGCLWLPALRWFRSRCTAHCAGADSKNGTVSTDSTSAFGVVHDCDALWKQNVLKSDGQPFLRHDQAGLLDAILLPKPVALCEPTLITLNASQQEMRGRRQLHESSYSPAGSCH